MGKSSKAKSPDPNPISILSVTDNKTESRKKQKHGLTKASPATKLNSIFSSYSVTASKFFIHGLKTIIFMLVSPSLINL